MPRKFIYVRRTITKIVSNTLYSASSGIAEIIAATPAAV